MSADGGVHEVPALFYGRLNEQGAIGYRPARIGRYTILGMQVGPDAVTVELENGYRVRIHPSQITLSYRAHS